MVTPKSIRQQVYEKWVENPYLKPKQVCFVLELDYHIHGNYVKKLLSEYRSYHKFVLPLEPHLPHRRVFVWENILRDLVKLPNGWVEVVNRNKMWVYHDDSGTVHWYRGGLVRLYLKGPVMLARAKELFCSAFSFLPWDQIRKYVDVPLREESKHWVFELGAPVPRFDIRQFERSHGMRIFADKSHPTGVEVEETSPFWISEIQNSLMEFGRLHEQFAKSLEEHVKLIKEWQKEAQERRKKDN